MAKAPSLRKDRNKGTLRTRRLYTENAPWSKGNGKGRFKGNTWRTIEGAEPCEVKASSTVVRPAKAGVFSRRKTYQGKSQSPVAWRAGGRETNLLKPLDSLICGMGASLQAVAQANAEVASKVRSPGGRACNREGEGSMGRRRLADAADHSGGVGATAWGQGHAKQLERPSASRREIGGSKVGCIGSIR